MRSKTLQLATNDTMDIYEECRQLFSKYYAKLPVRQISISVSNIKSNRYVQLDLFDKNRGKRLALAKTVDQLRDRFGSNTILRAVSYTDAGTSRARSTLVGGHLME